MEAAIKLARQYYLELDPPQPQRTRFISRRQSYHGITLGALAVGGHAMRRAKFEPIMMKNVSQVSPCFEYRGRTNGESDEAYVERLANELDDEYQRVGPDTVCAFVAEPVVGAVSVYLPRVSDNTDDNRLLAVRLRSPGISKLFVPSVKSTAPF
jgi:adenosylmethionine-8-amino-7-oxononanoate aminotransferase